MIPKVLFRPNSPERYIKLWICKRCHKVKTKNDEVVPFFIQAQSFSKESLPAYQRFIKSIKEGKNQGIHKWMLKNMTTVRVKENGVFQGVAPAFQIDEKVQNRIDDFFIAIAKGLYVWNSEIVPDWATFHTAFQFDQVLQSKKLISTSPFSEIWTKGKYGEEWAGHFIYKGDAIPEGSVWVMCVFDGILSAVCFMDAKVRERLLNSCNA